MLLSPEYGDLGTTNAKLAEVVDYIAEKMAADPTKKLLWGTAKCFDHPRYMHGAGTSPSADVFAYAAAQIKNAVDATIKLGGKGYVFWGGREGYETLLNTNMGLELDNMARLMIGTLLDIGFGLRKKEDIEAIFNGEKAVGNPCDPKGLYLQEVEY